MFEGKHVSFWIESIYDVYAIDLRANITNFIARVHKACARSVDVINKENEFLNVVPKSPLSTAVQYQFAAARIKENPIGIVKSCVFDRFNHPKPENVAIEPQLTAHILNIDDQLAEITNHRLQSSNGVPADKPLL